MMKIPAEPMKKIIIEVNQYQLALLKECLAKAEPLFYTEQMKKRIAKLLEKLQLIEK